MANDLVKIKDFPILDNYEDIDTEDRVVATHVAGSSRQTVGITVGALAQKVGSGASGNILIPKTLFGTSDPTAADGNNGDLYFKMITNYDGPAVTSSYVKINGQWVSFQVTDDNWRKFLEGQGFDVVTYDATSIKAHAFENNTLINNVIAPNVESVYEYAFRSCSVKSVYLPKCKLLDDYAFYQSKSYRNGTHIDLPSIETIGDHAFEEFGTTDNRQTINIQNVKTIGERAFYHTYFWKNKQEGILDLPNCESIGGAAFSAYGSSWPHIEIRKINLPAIKTIGSQAFRCIEAPNNFEFHIGPNCTYIGDNIFYTPSITNHKGTIYSYAITPPELVGGFYETYNGAEWFPEHLYVPYQSVNAYKSASKWSLYADQIEAIPEEE